MVNLLMIQVTDSDDPLDDIDKDQDYMYRGEGDPESEEISEEEWNLLLPPCGCHSAPQLLLLHLLHCSLPGCVPITGAKSRSTDISQGRQNSSSKNDIDDLDQSHTSVPPHQLYGCSAHTATTTTSTLATTTHRSHTW